MIGEMGGKGGAVMGGMMGGETDVEMVRELDNNQWAWLSYRRQTIYFNYYSNYDVIFALNTSNEFIA